MTKEEIFAALKKVILVFRDEGEKFLKDEAFNKECLKLQDDIQKATKELNTCDFVWLSEVYAEWFEKEMKPTVDALPDELKARIQWQ